VSVFWGKPKRFPSFCRSSIVQQLSYAEGTFSLSVLFVLLQAVGKNGKVNRMVSQDNGQLIVQQLTGDVQESTGLSTG